MLWLIMEFVQNCNLWGRTEDHLGKHTDRQTETQSSENKNHH